MMDQAILERIKTNLFSEEPQGDPQEGITSEGDPQNPLVDVSREIEEPEEAAEAEENSNVELEAESEDLEQESHEPEKWSLEEVAESLDTTVEELLNDWAIDVEGEKVTLAELKKGTLRESDYTKKTMSLSEERKALEEARKAESEKVEQELMVLGQMITATEQQLAYEYNQIDWKALKEDDPSEFVLKQNEYQQRYNQVQGLKNQAIHQYQAHKQKEQETLINETAPKERNALVQKIPEFKDSTKFDDGMRKITDYLTGLGYSSDEMAKMVDHRQYVLAHKARLYDELQSKKPEIEKKAKSVPKVLKPKGRKPKESAETKRQKELRQRFRKSGKLDDFAALIRLGET